MHENIFITNKHLLMYYTTCLPGNESKCFLCQLNMILAPVRAIGSSIPSCWVNVMRVYSMLCCRPVAQSFGWTGMWHFGWGREAITYANTQALQWLRIQTWAHASASTNKKLLQHSVSENSNISFKISFIFSYIKKYCQHFEMFKTNSRVSYYSFFSLWTEWQKHWKQGHLSIYKNDQNVISVTNVHNRLVA